MDLHIHTLRAAVLVTGNMVQRIEPTALIDAAEGIADVDAKLLNACIKREVQVYVRVPQGFVATTLGIAGYTGVLLDSSDDEQEDDGSRIVLDYTSVGAQVADYRMEYIRLAASDLELLREKKEATLAEFSCGGLIPQYGPGYAFVEFEDCRIAHRGSTTDPFNDSRPPVALTIDVSKLFVDLESLPQIRQLVQAELRVEDRWGHREDAPAVHLIYRAAQHFATEKYTFKAAKAWLCENDTKGLFEGKSKALDYAARLINRSPTKKSVESGTVLELNKISRNVMNRDYREPVASNRLSLLHLATDCWVHDRKYPSEPRFLVPDLSGFLHDLGFTKPDDTGVVKGKERNVKAAADHRVNPLECQVEYLSAIIESRPQS